MDGLKRLSGAKEVAQDDFSAGVATYIVKFEGVPATKVADVKANMGKYKLEEVKLKITTKAGESPKVGDITLTGEEGLKSYAELKGKKVLLTGVLTDSEKGRNLALTKVEEVK